MSGSHRNRQSHGARRGNDRDRDSKQHGSTIPVTGTTNRNGASPSTYNGPRWGHPVPQEALMKEVGLPTGVHPTNSHTVDTNKWSYENIYPGLVSFVFNTAKANTLHPYEDQSYDIRRGIAIVPTLSRTRAGRQIPRGQLPYSQRTIAPDYISPDEDAHPRRNRKHRRRYRDDDDDDDDDDQYSSDSAGGGVNEYGTRNRHDPGASQRNAHQRRGVGRGEERGVRSENRRRDGRDDDNLQQGARSPPSEHRNRRGYHGHRESRDDISEEGDELSQEGEEDNHGTHHRREASSSSASGRRPRQEGDIDDDDASREQGSVEGGGEGERRAASAPTREPNVSDELKERYRRAVEAKEAQTKETQIRRYLKLHRDCARAGFEPIAQLSDPQAEDIPRLQKCIREMEAELEKHKFVENRIGSVRTGAGMLVALNRTLGNVIPLEEPESANGDSGGGGGGFMDMVKQVTEECRDDFDELFDMQLQQKGSVRAVQGHPLMAMGSKFLQRCSSHYLWSKFGIDTSDPIATSVETLKRSGRSEDDVYRTRHETGGAADDPAASAAKPRHADHRASTARSARSGASSSSSSSPSAASSSAAAARSELPDDAKEEGDSKRGGANSKLPAIANRNRPPSDANTPAQSSSSSTPTSSGKADVDNARRAAQKATSSNDPSSSNASPSAATTARTAKSKQALHSGVNLDGNGLPINNTHALMEKQASKANVAKSVSVYTAL